MAQTPLSRRGFMHATTLSASAAFLAACGAKSGASASAGAPASAAASAEASAPASAAGSAAPSTGAVSGDIEKELFMYNWGDYVDPDNIEAFKAKFGVDEVHL
ncbi:MAG: hypothetical protein WKF78_04900 [Candidatus Limnocylindrales bacterium]